MKSPCNRFTEWKSTYFSSSPFEFASRATIHVIFHWRLLGELSYIQLVKLKIHLRPSSDKCYQGCAKNIVSLPWIEWLKNYWVSGIRHNAVSKASNSNVFFSTFFSLGIQSSSLFRFVKLSHLPPSTPRNKTSRRSCVLQSEEDL